MSLPDLRLDDYADRTTCDAWRGVRVDVGRLYDVLTGRGWKIDREESNLMVSLCRTWREHGVKVYLLLAAFVCAPPDGELEAVDELRFFRFDPGLMPTTGMYEQMYDPGDEDEDWYPGHREEWEWLLLHGDPQDDERDLLSPAYVGQLPAAVLEQLRDDLLAAAREA